MPTTAGMQKNCRTPKMIETPAAKVMFSAVGTAEIAETLATATTSRRI
jgi:hypothetical protein